MKELTLKEKEEVVKLLQNTIISVNGFKLFILDKPLKEKQVKLVTDFILCQENSG